MTSVVTYELQTYENGTWQIAGMFEERELALVEARRMEEGLRRRETRVVEESQDDATGRTRSKIIYTSPQVRSQRAGTAPRPMPAPAGKPKPRAERPDRSGRGGLRQPMQRQPGVGMIILTFTAILCLGVASLALLRHFAG